MGTQSQTVRSARRVAAVVSAVLAVTLCTFRVATAQEAASTTSLAAPTATGAPSITGIPTVGSRITGTPGTWSGSPTSYRFQWQRCLSTSCVNVSSGDNDPTGKQTRPLGKNVTYLVKVSDVGAQFKLQVIALNGGGPATTPSLSSATPPVDPVVPTIVSAPTIPDTPIVGRALRGLPGAWLRNPISYTFRWQRCTIDCVDVPVTQNDFLKRNQRGFLEPATIMVLPTDVGVRFRLSVVASNTFGAALEQATSGVSAPALNPQAPVLLSAPTVTGPTTVGSTLTGWPGSWSNNATIYYFRWQRCTATGCADVSGMDNDPQRTQQRPITTPVSYVLQPTDVGARLRLKVVAANSGGTSTGSGISIGTMPVKR